MGLPGDEMSLEGMAVGGRHRHTVRREIGNEIFCSWPENFSLRLLEIWPPIPI